MRSFVHFMLSSLVLSGAGTSDKLTPLSFLDVLHLGKAQFSPGIIILFSEKVSQTLPKITNETLSRCLFTISMQVQTSRP